MKRHTYKQNVGNKKNIFIREIQGLLLPLLLLLALLLPLPLHFQLWKNLSVQKDNIHLIKMLKIYSKKRENMDIIIRLNIENSISSNLNRLINLFNQKIKNYKEVHFGENPTIIFTKKHNFKRWSISRIFKEMKFYHKTIMRHNFVIDIE